jgi:hypothetical protein
MSTYKNPNLSIFGLNLEEKLSVYHDTGGFSSKFYPQKYFVKKVN